MGSESALELRVGRLENDSAALYELLDDFRGETRGEFAKINGTLNEFREFRGEARGEFAKINGTLDEFRTRFAKIDGTLEQILQRLPAAAS